MAVIIPATGSGTATPTVATEAIASAHYQQVKLIDGTATSTTAIVAGGGVEAGALRVTVASDSTGLLSVDDNGASLTVDGTVSLGAGVANIGDVDVLTVPAPLSTTGGGTEATALRVTVANDSTGVLSVDDNGGALTVDGTVAVSSVGGTVDTELPAAVALGDNAGNPTAPAVGAFGMVWDGATWDRAPGNSTDGTLVNLGANNDVTVTGTVSLGAGTANVGDVDVLTVPAPLSTTGGGTEATALRVTVASDSTGVLSVDDNGSSLTVDNGGTFAVQATQAGTWTVQPGNTANTTAWLVSERPATSGGQTIFRRISTADTNAASVKGSAGQVYGVYMSNINASPRYVKLYNKATAPTVGTDTPVMTLLVPGNTAGAGGTFGMPSGIAFGTGIGVAITTGVADSDTGAVAANEIVVHLFYT